MAIKDQCLQCVHFTSGICGTTNSMPLYDQMSCNLYKKIGISLEKTTTEITNVSSASNVSQPTKRGKQSMFANPFSFEGRIRRSEYWISFIIAYLYAIMVGFFVGVTNGGMGMVYLFLIPDYWFLWAQGAKRCHDRDNTGWYQIIPFYVLWMLFGDGDAYENSYGVDPKGREMIS